MTGFERVLDNALWLSMGPMVERGDVMPVHERVKKIKRATSLNLLREWLRLWEANELQPHCAGAGPSEGLLELTRRIVEGDIAGYTE